MTSWRAWYWRVYNVLVRGLGAVALVSGLVFTVIGAFRILQMGLLLNEGAPPLVTMGIGLLLIMLGAGIVRTPAYRPDLGDVWWRFDPYGIETGKPQPNRSWWTGERMR